MNLLEIGQRLRAMANGNVRYGIEANQRFRIVRVVYDDRGRSTVIPLTPWTRDVSILLDATEKLESGETLE